MMRALVTGASGFVGRHMAAELVQRGWTVTGVDVKAVHPLLAAVSRYQHVAADALRVFRGTILSVPPFDLVVHCAYTVGGRAVIDGQPMALAGNLILDSAAFDWALRTGQHRFLYFSSSAAYPVDYQQRNRVPSWLVEDSIDLGRAMEPDANYGWAKLTGERLAKAAAGEGLRVHVVRPFSGYGATQDTSYPFPALMARVAARQNPVEVWGDPEQMRDWIHITDVVNASLAVVEADERRPVNLCTGIPTSMTELIRAAAGMAGYRPEIVALRDKPMGVYRRVGSPERMNSMYKPQVSLEDGIGEALRRFGD